MDNAVQEKIGFPYSIDTEIDLPLAVKATVTVIDQISPGEAFIILEKGLPKRLLPGLIHVWGRWLLRMAKEIDEYYEYPKK